MTAHQWGNRVPEQSAECADNFIQLQTLLCRDMWWDVQDGHWKLTMWAGPQSSIFQVGLMGTVHSRINYFRNIMCWSCREPGSWCWRKDTQIGMEEPSEKDGNRTQQCALVIPTCLLVRACVHTIVCRHLYFLALSTERPEKRRPHHSSEHTSAGCVAAHSWARRLIPGPAAWEAHTSQRI